MAHGFSAIRHMTTDRYATVLSDASFSVLLYDHRNFGASDGEPRQQINPWIQARSYRDAISFLRATDGIHPVRIAIWGDSLSGGVALAVAAVDSRVAALIAQVPACGPELPQDDPNSRRFRAIADTIVSGEVQASAAEVQGPMPVVSDDQVRRPSALQPLTAYRWFIEYGGRLGTHWVNDVTRAQPRTPEPWDPALCAAHVTPQRSSWSRRSSSIGGKRRWGLTESAQRPIRDIMSSWASPAARLRRSPARPRPTPPVPSRSAG